MEAAAVAATLYTEATRVKLNTVEDTAEWKKIQEEVESCFSDLKILFGFMPSPCTLLPLHFQPFVFFFLLFFSF